MVIEAHRLGQNGSEPSVPATGPAPHERELGARIESVMAALQQQWASFDAAVIAREDLNQEGYNSLRSRMNELEDSLTSIGQGLSQPPTGPRLTPQQTSALIARLRQEVAQVEQRGNALVDDMEVFTRTNQVPSQMTNWIPWILGGLGAAGLIWLYYQQNEEMATVAGLLSGDLEDCGCGG